jgi:hypothetical protein
VIIKLQIPNNAKPVLDETPVPPGPEPSLATESLNSWFLQCTKDPRRKSPPDLHPVLQSSQATIERMQTGSTLLARAWSWLATIRVQSASKRLRVVETVPLGEKRFVALVQVDTCQFLIGGGTSGISLLAQVGAEQNFSSLVQQKLSATNENPNESL